jgi:hypothetical protein
MFQSYAVKECHMNERSNQGASVLTRTQRQVTVPREMIWARKTAGQAIRLAMDAAMLDDKEVYLSLEIDAGTWSRILSDKANLPFDKIAQFCSAVGNRILVEWITFQVGCMPVLIETEAERLYLSERDRADKLEAALIVIAGLQKAHGSTET